MSQAQTPNEQDQPFCPEGDFRFWASVGAAALLALTAAYLAGLGPLFPHGLGDLGAVSASTTLADGAAAATDASKHLASESIGILRRISGALSNLVWVGLCTGAGSLAFAAVAMVHGRRPGSAFDIVGRAFACVAVANLVRVVPMEGVILKTIFDVGAFVVSAALLSRAAYRVRLLDASAVVALAFGAVAVLTALAYAVVWAVLPKDVL